MLQDAFRASQRARERSANPNLMPPGRFLIEQRVKRNDPLDVGGAQVELFGHKLDNLFGNPVAVCLLTKVQCRYASRLQSRVTRNDLVEHRALLRTKAEGHGRFRLDKSAATPTLTRRALSASSGRVRGERTVVTANCPCQVNSPTAQRMRRHSIR